MLITARHKIDESHGVSHSMDVLHFAHNIYNSELPKNPELAAQERLIYVSAIIHDMCDKKYMNEKEGIENYKFYLSGYMNYNELDAMSRIIETMSYSKVKSNGFPTNLNEYNQAYHIVREADLLASYDIDRSIMYAMYKYNLDYSTALQNSLELFDNRILKMRKNKLFITNYSKKASLKLEKEAIKNVNYLKNII